MIQPDNGRTVSRSIDASLAVILLLALMIRLAIAPLGAHPGDLPVLMRWAHTLRESGWLSVYAASDANYPPLGMALIGVSQWVFDALFPASPLGGPVWLIFVKLPSILADLLLIAAITPLARTRAAARWLALSLALNPALILMSAWWGQLDSVYAGLTVLSFIAALRGSPLGAGLLFGAAAMTKQQAIFFAPVVALGVFLHQGKQTPENTSGFSRSLNFHPRLRTVFLFSIGALFPIALAFIPFVITRQGGFVLNRMVALVSGPNWPTINALNAWYLFTGGAGNWQFNQPLTLPDTTPLIAGLTYRQIGVGLLIGWLALILALAARVAARMAARARHADAWLLAGALTALGIFLWPTQAHERYSLAAVGFAAAWSAACRWEKSPNLIRILPANGEISLNGHAQRPILLWSSDIWYAMISISIATNLMWAAPPWPWLERALHSSALAGQREIGLVIAAGMLLLALWGVWTLSALAHRPCGEKKPDDAGSTS